MSANRIDAAERTLLHGATATATITLLSGCSSAPSRNILGSYFPSWMICALIGMVWTLYALDRRPRMHDAHLFA